MTTKSNDESVDQAKVTGQSGKLPKQAEGAHTGEIGDVNDFPEWQQDPALIERQQVDIQADEDAATEEPNEARHGVTTREGDEGRTTRASQKKA
jgi:hypothetical protein